MKNRRNYYRILQVQPDAPIEILRASYHALMHKLKQHPDLGGSTSNAALLNEAYETLSDPQRRAAYDEELFDRFTGPANAPNRRPFPNVFCPVCRKSLARKPQPGETCPTCRTPLQSKKPSDLEQDHQRSLARRKSDARILYYSAWPGRARAGRMVDLSPRGMRFLCSEKLTPGTVLKISSRLFEASGTVTNLREEVADGQGSFAIGICFLAISFAEPRGVFLSTSA
jgi:curved DNA-binding protein CbpA